LKLVGVNGEGNNELFWEKVLKFVRFFYEGICEEEEGIVKFLFEGRKCNSPIFCKFYFLCV